MLGNSAAQAELNRQLDLATARLDDNGAAALDNLSANLGVEGAVDDVRAAVKGQNAELEAAISAKRLEAEASKGSATSAMTYKSAVEEATTWTAAYGETSSDTAKDIAEVEQATKALYDSLRLLNGEQISVEESSIAFRDQIRGMADEVKTLKEEHGKNALTLQGSSAAADANRKILLEGIKAAEDAAKATYEKSLKTKDEEAALKDASAVMGQHIKTLQTEAVNLGYNGKDVDKYIAKQLGIPVKQVTNYTAPGLKEATANAKDLEDTIDRIEPKTVKFKMILDSSGIPKEVIAYKGRSTSGKNRRQEADGYARGGWLDGPGTSTSDDIPIWASKDEFVVNAKDARENAALLEAINSGKMIHGYAAGGRVNSDTISRSFSTPGMATALEHAGAAANMWAALEKQVSGQLKDWFTEAAGAVMGTPGGPFPGGSSAVGSWRGKHYTHAMIARLMKAEQLAGTTMYVSQGGFRPTTSYSGTTHNKDAVDVGSPTTVRMQNALRAAGIAAWIRTPSQGPWSRHIHGIPLPGGGVQLSASALAQTQSYRRGGNGLKGYDTGGYLDPGLTLAYNGTGHPERVLSAAETRAHGGGDTYVTLELNANAPIGSQRELQTWLVASLDGLKRSGRLP